MQEYNDSFIITYTKWHYTKGLKEFLTIVGNFLWFTSNFFSFSFFANTLFEPWKEIADDINGNLRFVKVFTAKTTNFLMILLGFLAKLAILIIGSAAFILVVVVSFCTFVIWLTAPAVLIGSIVLAITFFMI